MININIVNNNNNNCVFAAVGGVPIITTVKMTATVV